MGDTDGFLLGYLAGWNDAKAGRQYGEGRSALAHGWKKVAAILELAEAMADSLPASPPLVTPLSPDPNWHYDQDQMNDLESGRNQGENRDIDG